MVHGAAAAAKADADATGGSGGSIAWVGSADGEVVLVRHDISVSEGSTGGRRSRATGGSEANGVEPQPQMSAFGRAQSGSNPGSSNLTHSLQVRLWHALQLASSCVPDTVALLAWHSIGSWL
jgi:hypothetical protein